MTRREFRTLDEIDRCVWSIDMAEALRKNPSLTDAERELIEQWFREDAYGGKIGRHEREHESLKRKIELAREIAAIENSRSLWWAKFAFWLAATALLLSIVALVG